MSLTLTPTQAPLHRGYKRTAVGVIPEDWTIRSLLSCLRSAPNYGINAAAIPFDDTLPTYLRITDIGEDNQFRPSPRVSVRHPSVQTFFLNKGDLVFARTGASVGKSYLYNPNDGPLVFAGFLIRVSPNPGELEPDFLAYCVQSKRYWNWVTRVSVRSGQPGINGQEYGTLQLPLPGPAEQRAIATALRDVDALLDTLDRLIAKKRDLKQATMQHLLTGQTRLPGFHGEWEVKRLGEALTICHGKNQREVAVADGPFPILATGGQIGTASRPLFDEPSVLIGRKGTINQPQFMETPFWTVDTLFYCSMKDGNDAKFFYYRFCLIDWMQFNEASGVPSLNARTIEKIEIPCPQPPEQVAIAAVLSDMDAELSVLEARRDKTRDLKKAMMQELLTGKTRLVAVGGAPA